jgi:hypothetical protein
VKIFAAIVDAETVRMFYKKTGIKLNYLISYFYLENNAYKLIFEYRDMIESLYLDSGAYSVATGKSKISITEYLTYLKLYGHHFDEYFNLDDEFDNPNHNQSNQQYLEKELLPLRAKRPIPVVHDEEQIIEFEEYVELGNNFIAIGSDPAIKIVDLQKIMNKFPDVNIHMFGNIKREMLVKCKPYSADSATWAHNSMYGGIAFWDPDEQKDYKIYMGTREIEDPEKDWTHFKKFKHRKKLEAFLHDTFGFQYRDLLPRDGAYNRHIVNLYFFYQFQEYLNTI